MFQKLDKLLAVEIISLTFVITSGISSIMLMAKLPRYADFLFSAPDILTSFLMLLLFILPSILKLTVPVSLLLSCAIVIMRMSADRELEAWMSCGVSILRFAFMPCLLGLGVMVMSLASALYFEPYSNRQFDQFKWLQSRTMVESFINQYLKEKAFIYDFKDAQSDPKHNLSLGHANLSMYFGSINSNKTQMNDIFIAFSEPNKKYSSFIVANTGALSKEMVSGYPDYIFKLYDGYIYSYEEGKESLAKLHNDPSHSHYIFNDPKLQLKDFHHFPAPKDWTVTKYKNINLSLVTFFKDKFKLGAGPESGMDQLYPSQYLKVLEVQKAKDNNWKKNGKILSKIIFIIKQVSIPISTIFLPLIGVCLGILDPRRKQVSVYLGVGVVIFALYASLSICQQLALKFVVSPYSVLFVTPLTLVLILLFLLRWRSSCPPSCGFLEFLYNDFSLLKTKISFRKSKTW